MSAQEIIDAAWEERATLSPGKVPRSLRQAVEEAIAALDAGRLRVPQIDQNSTLRPAIVECDLAQGQ